MSQFKDIYIVLDRTNRVFTVNSFDPSIYDETTSCIRTHRRRIIQLYTGAAHITVSDMAKTSQLVVCRVATVQVSNLMEFRGDLIYYMQQYSDYTHLSRNVANSELSEKNESLIISNLTRIITKYPPRNIMDRVIYRLKPRNTVLSQIKVEILMKYNDLHPNSTVEYYNEVPFPSAPAKLLVEPIAEVQADELPDNEVEECPHLTPVDVEQQFKAMMGNVKLDNKYTAMGLYQSLHDIIYEYENVLVK